MAEAKSENILGETYEPGKPDGPISWRGKLTSRDQKLKYLQTGERYWYSQDWYGSERRREPA